MNIGRWSGKAFGLLIAAVLTGMAGLHLGLNLALIGPLQDRVQTLQTGMQAHRKNAAQNQDAVPNPRRELSDILGHLPAQSQLLPRLEAIHQLARQQGVGFRQAAYQQKVLEPNIVRSEMNIELSASYPALRQFVRNMLLRDDAIAIESLDLNKPLESTSAVQAQLKLYLYAQAPSP